MIGMRVVIRTDASIKIGSGHLMRCLSLADGLRDRGARVTFITREHTGHLSAVIEARGFSCRRMRAAETSMNAGYPHTTGHAHWLGCTQDEDAQDTEVMMREIGTVDWLIVDHYALDIRWERGLRKHARHIMVIDDLADRRHDCDILLDQNLYADFETRYRPLMPRECVALLGPRYALLSSDFARQRGFAEFKQIASPYRLLVFFGGVDATDETGKFLQAWAAVRRSDLVATVVIGATNPRADSLTDLASQLAGIQVHRHVTNMAEMMVQADYAFGASGVTNWERFCAGLNSTITSVASNQLVLARDLAAFGLIHYLGDWRRTSVATYERALLELDPAAEEFVQRRTRILNWVDGQGVPRVLRQMTENGVE